ncbi:MAG: TVP38/TMEM64 family protein [Chromatiaceae bacterium]|nr:TVP38/TMEM64 family protein [Chromatiaceae bacterium]
MTGRTGEVPDAGLRQMRTDQGTKRVIGNGIEGQCMGTRLRKRIIKVNGNGGRCLMAESALYRVTSKSGSKCFCRDGKRLPMNSFTRMTIAIVIALLIPVVPFAVVGELPGDRWLHGIADEGWLFGLASAALLASDTLLPIPSSIIGTLLGGRLGFLPGLTWCWLGLMLGSATAYGVGYVFLRQFATRLPETPSLLVLFASRAVPVLAEAVAVSAGSTQMRLVPFFAVTALGNGLYATVLAGNGAALLPDSLTGVGLIIPMLLPLLSWVAWRLIARRRAMPPVQSPD